MDRFEHRDGSLHAEEVPLSAVAAAHGTPTFVYSAGTFRTHLRRLREAFAPLRPQLCYSVKSCSNLAILRLAVEEDAGLDLVSGGELHRAILAGADPSRCVLAGVGKTDREIAEALEAGVGVFNIESAEELANVARIADDLDRPARAALRINPEVEPGTHRHTATGRRATKFGVDLATAVEVFRGHDPRSRLRLCGLHLHIGSPIATTAPYVDAIDKVLELRDSLRRHGLGVEVLDLGGGFAADYVTGQAPPASTYAAAIVPRLRAAVEEGLELILEPGRSIVANSGVLLVRVTYVKESGGRRFVICDAGMNALLRPSHYDAFHFVWPCEVPSSLVPSRREERPDLPDLEEVDVVGPLCETGDYLALGRSLPPVERGDLLAIYAAGAYGMSMASRYNSSPLPAEVLVDGSSARLVRRRETYEDLVAHEVAIPSPSTPLLGALR